MRKNIQASISQLFFVAEEAAFDMQSGTNYRLTIDSSALN